MGGGVFNVPYNPCTLPGTQLLQGGRGLMGSGRNTSRTTPCRLLQGGWLPTNRLANRLAAPLLVLLQKVSRID